MKALYIISLLILTVVSDCNGQIDTEFWFAPPEVTSGHGDRPIYLRISTQDKPSTVRISQPARGDQELGQYNIASATTLTVNLTGFISQLETDIPGIVMKTGIRITATTPITVYYEEASSFNAEIFVLKGKNAMGNLFVIPWQRAYDNNPIYVPTPYASFDVVATQNNTVIQVEPTQPIAGHERDTVITVKLNRGETYSFKKTTLLASSNPSGTIVTSNKPISITIKDDSVIKGGCHDLLGDQLIPVKVAGMEYVVPKGFLNAPEYLYIMATEDDTDVYVSGVNVPVVRLARGQSHQMEITIASIYIRASKKVHVLHVTGFGCEVGMAVLPPVTCTGSKQISFTRSTDEFFGMNILVRKEGIFYFKLNGSSSLITSDKFRPVIGTNDTWYSAQISYSVQDVPVNMASLISNDRYSFQAGIINGNAATSCRYGYFSSFSTLFIGDDFAMCAGDTAIIDAGPGKELYTWNTGANTQKIKVHEAGDYWVTVQREECVLSDTLHVDVVTGSLDLGPDVELCLGETSNIDGKENFSWLWSNGGTGRFLETSELGKYWVSVYDYTGCPASDTILISRYQGIIDDKVDITMSYVSVDTLEPDGIRTAWRILYPELIPGSIVSLYKRSGEETDWALESTFTQKIQNYRDNGNATDDWVYEYYVTLSDKCGEEHRIAPLHGSMLLTVQADSVNDVIQLQWSPYQGWDVERYEVWRKLENQTGYQLLARVPGSQNQFSAAIGADGFRHQFVVRAVKVSGESESWSNPSIAEFRHPVTVPNVFTPNGDAYNQFFYIRKIELYTNSDLVVIDRWGVKVFEAVGYKNDWSGEGLSTGVYFYVLDLKKNNQVLQGTVQILK